MHPLYRHIAQNNDAPWKDYTPLYMGGKDVGRVHHKIMEELLCARLLQKTQSGLELTQEKPDLDGRTGQLRTILHHLIEKKFIAKERFEAYSVSTSFKDAPIALADRALIPALGFVAFGVHCNGYVKKDDGIHIWIGKRSADRATDPGKYDHLIAGGQPHGLTLRENLAKEAHEEAGVHAKLIEKAIPVGCVTYSRAQPNGIRRDALFLFDLKCPDDFTPHNQDGEVEDFRLMSAREVLSLLHTSDAFKFNVNLVLIDFFIRHGLIPSDDPGYAELCSGLHAPHVG